MMSLLAATGTAEATSDWLAALAVLVERVDGYVWGLPLILAVFVTGILITLIVRLQHLRNLGRAFRYMLFTEKGGYGEVSAFGALCTALAATIGIGNIVGVATAVGTGGPGALFWMMIAAFFGMGSQTDACSAVRSTTSRRGSVRAGRRSRSRSRSSARSHRSWAPAR